LNSSFSSSKGLHEKEAGFDLESGGEDEADTGFAA
jgi:hypothetical protein